MIPLTKDKIDAALPKLAKAVEIYERLQSDLHRMDVSANRQFQKTFNGYYRVRRNAEWQKKFYELLEKYKGSGVDFERVLVELHNATGRMEASFSSKLVGSIDPNQPIIDSVVLKHLDERIPPKGTEEREQVIKNIHQRLVLKFAEFLKTDAGKYLVQQFKMTYKTANLTEVKMLDFVLWVTREKKRG